MPFSILSEKNKQNHGFKIMIAISWLYSEKSLGHVKYESKLWNNYFGISN